jgi:hypothetical protein
MPKRTRDGVSIQEVEQEQEQEYKVTSLLKKEIRGSVAWWFCGTSVLLADKTFR